MIEEWKVAAGWPLYEVSSFGCVRRAKPGKGTHVGKVLKRGWGTNGYFHVMLSQGDGHQKTVLIHQLVCRTFHGERPKPGMHAAHKNGDRADNAARNMYWLTVSDNLLDRRRHGTGTEGRKNTQSKLIEADIPLLRQLALEHSQTYAARHFGVSNATVSLIMSRKHWSHVL